MKLKLMHSVIFILVGSLNSLVLSQPWLITGNPNVGAANFLGPTSNTTLQLRTTFAQPIIFQTNGQANERMRITQTGFVGIGTSVPQTFTHFHNPATGLFQSSFTQWTNPSTTAGANRGLFVGNLGSTALITQAEASEMIFSTAGSSRVAIRGTAGFNQGFIAIGNSFTNPQHLVDVRDGDVNVGNGNAASPQGYMIGDNYVVRHKGETRNIFVGVDAGADNTDPAAIENTFVGNNAGRSNITGDRNTFVGSDAGRNIENGRFNTFVGTDAGENLLNGNANTFVGEHCGFNHISGDNNTYLGSHAGQGGGGILGNSTGSNNICLGMNAGPDIILANDNTFTGTFVAANCQYGERNSFFGMRAGQFTGQLQNTGSDNVFMGWRTGLQNRGGNFNTYIGTEAGPAVGVAFQNLDNAAAIGANALTTASNTMILGDNAVNVGIGLSGVTTAPLAKLEINAVAGNGTDDIDETPGASGLKFRDLTANSDAAASNSTNTVLSVDDEGDVILVNSGGGGGQGTCNNNPTTLNADNGVVKLNQNNYYFEGNTTTNDKVAIGLDCGDALSSKLHVNQNTNDPAYAHISNLQTGFTANDGFKVGVAANGTAEIRQLENAPMEFWTIDQNSSVNGPVKRAEFTSGGQMPASITGGGPVDGLRIWNPGYTQSSPYAPFNCIDLWTDGGNSTHIRMDEMGNLQTQNLHFEQVGRYGGFWFNASPTVAQYNAIQPFPNPPIRARYIFNIDSLEVARIGTGVTNPGAHPNHTISDPRNGFFRIGLQPSVMGGPVDAVRRLEVFDIADAPQFRITQNFNPDITLGVFTDFQTTALGDLYINTRSAGDMRNVGIHTYTPVNTVEIFSGIAATTLNPTSATSPTRSGLRFSSLNSTMTVDGTGSGKVLSVNETGDVILVNDAGGGGFGVLCPSTNPTVDGLQFNTDVPLNNKNLIFSGTGPTGNLVGIGTSCFPAAKLQVNYDHDNSSNFGGILSQVNVTGTNIQVSYGLKSDVDGTVTDTKYGVRGGATNFLGTSVFSIGIQGDARDAADANYGGNFTAAGSSPVNAGIVTLASGGTDHNFNIYAGNITGTPVPNGSYAGVFQGNVYTYGGSQSGTGYLTVSDSQLKADIVPFESGLNVIRNIEPISYRLNGKAGFDSTKVLTGVIAENLVSIAPYAVDTFYSKLDTSDAMPTALLSVSNEAIIYSTINAVKDLDSIVSAMSPPSGTVTTTGSPSVGTVPVFTGSSTIGNSNIYDDGVNVGIGTTSPNTRLQVNGAGSGSGNLFKLNNPSTTLFYMLENGTTVFKHGSSISNADNIFTVSNASFPGNDAKFIIRGDGSVFTNSNSPTSVATGSFTAKHKTFELFDVSGANRSIFFGMDNEGGGVQYVSTGIGTRQGEAGYGTGNLLNLYQNSLNANGIYISFPDQTHNAPASYFRKGIVADLTTPYHGTGVGQLTSIGVDVSVANSDNDIAIRVQSGDVQKPGGGSWSTLSDQQLKTDIESYEAGMELIRNINPVSFKYNGLANTPTNKECIGVIAQEIVQHAPYIVDSAYVLLNEGDSIATPVLTTNNEPLFFAAINAIRQLAAEDSANKAAIDSLSSVITDQQSAINDLQSALAANSQSTVDSLQSAQITAIQECINNLPEGLGCNHSRKADPGDRKEENGSQQITLESSAAAILYQNEPNPFSNSTVIRYYVPESTKEALLVFHDEFGREISKEKLSSKGYSKVDINSEKLAAGIYTYSIVVDGKVADTKKMLKAK